MTLFFIAFFSVAATCQHAQNHPSMMDGSLIGELFKLKFKLGKKVSFIDNSYLTYIKLYDSDYCVAERGQKFSETDNREIGLCWDRLVLLENLEITTAT